MAYDIFVTGDILTAADANDNFMEQVISTFASAAARGAAITAPKEGQYCYLEDTNATEIYDGSNWVSASNSINAGSTLIAATTFTAATSVSVNNCFTSLYDTYLIDFQATNPGSPKIFMRLSGTDSIVNYNNFILTTSGAAGVTVTGSTETNVATGMRPFAISSQAAMTGQTFLTNPGLAIATFFNSVPNHYSNSGPSKGVSINSGVHNVATAYDGFTITMTSSNGFVKVYGLKK